MKPQYQWCYHHHEYEDATGDVYRICIECGHVYRDESDLVNAYNFEAKYMAEHWAELLHEDFSEAPVRHLTVAEAEHIGFCQYCLHDW